MDLKEEIAAGKAIAQALPDVVDVALVGSALYMPAEAAGDIDFAVMLADGRNARHYATAMCQDGWEACGEYDTNAGTWVAVRRDNLNLMLTHDRAFFDGYKLAMEVCKVLRLESRDDRIAVCRVVRDGLPAEIVRPSEQDEIIF